MATVAKNTRSTTSTVAVSTAGPFSVGFRLFDDDALNVYVNDVQRADFTITSNYMEGYDDTASITFDSALSISDTLRIEGWLSPGRAADLVNGDENLVAKMNVELARIWSSLIEVQREASRSLRSFTEMAPAAGIDLEAIVGAEAFALAAAASASAASTSAAAALAAENSLLEWKGAWLTATAYDPSDIVQESGNSYVCVTGHTSGTFATDLGAGLWELFAAKGSAGAGSGDVLAANNGSDFASDVSFRTNLKIPGRLSASIGTNDFNSDYDSRETSMFLVAASPLNGPAGGAAGDWVSWFRTDSNNIRAVWHLNDGSVATRTKVSGTWGDWLILPTVPATGVGQTWQNLNASRSSDVSYLNDTGRPIQVLIRWRSTSSTNRDLQVSPDGSTWTEIAISNGAANSPETVSAIIPPGNYYRIVGAVSNLRWSELR